MDILNRRYKEVYERNKICFVDNRNPQRYLFLDIDGVLNTWRYSDYLTDHNEDITDEDGAIFDPEAVANLAYIIEKVPDVKIIIFSTWRLNGWDWMNRMWKKRKLPGEIFSFTPVLDSVSFLNLFSQISSESVYPYGTRGLEINEWIRLYACSDFQSFKYVIIDDNNDFLAMQREHVINTNSYHGITKEDAEKVIEMLL